ncbi:hypothetical protein KXR83_05880 [Williamsia muralis]
MAQAPSGRNMIGVHPGRGETHAISSFGLSQNENITLMNSWVDKTLPSGVSASNLGLAKMVFFKGNFYLQAMAGGTTPSIYRAAPIANPGTFTWSSALATITESGASIITSGLATDGDYLYWCSYGDPVGGPRVLRSADGTTWTTTLGPGTFAARHCHGVFPDPFNPGHVWMSCGDGGSAGYFYRSTDHGENWSIVPGALGTNQAYQAVQVSFSETHIYFGPDTTANWSAFRADRETLTPQWLCPRTHRLVAVPGGLPARHVTDLVTTSGSSTVTSATAAFTALDRGSRIRTKNQPVIPSDTYIASVTNSTTVVLTKTATATSAGWTSGTILGGEHWGVMAYYGAVDPASGIYYFVSINGGVGGNVDGLFALMPNGELTLLEVLSIAPDSVVTIANGRVWVHGFQRPLLAI